MSKRILILSVVILICSAPCSAQTFFDSVLGPGGLGLWGGDPNTISDPAYGSQPSYPNQNQQQGQQQGYPPAQGQYPPANPQGVYSDWQNYPPAVPGNTSQMQYTDPQQYQAEQQAQQYQQGQAGPQQYPPQQYPQQQNPNQRPLSWQAPPGGQNQGRQLPPGQYSAGQPRQGQYVPNQYPQGPTSVAAEDLPAGSVRVTTTTPDGTTIEFYPPNGESQELAPPRPSPKQKPRARPQAAKPNAAQLQQGTGAPKGAIAMPKPVQVPQAQDPRFGWGSVPVAPEQ